MAMSETGLAALLRALDGPERPEWPLHYEPSAPRLALRALVRRLETDFGAPCEYEHDARDTSE
ncbi:hypothetical protein [Streptomyces sp. NPDC102283]|uniref:hypothetical protein n=1 Tax=Streptomyces sp. NPDC102283 TaxID=3366155 RepID=UPI003803EA90